MIIVGAGMAGLLAANMLRKHNPTVIEKNDQLPNNHSAVLRFRTSVVGDTLGIQFKKVNMIKTAVPWRNPIADSLMYSFKNTGVRRSDRSINTGLVSETRFIAPPDLIPQMVGGIPNNKICLRYNFTAEDVVNKRSIISTLAMPVLMEILKYQDPTLNFIHRTGINVQAKILNCDAYVSLLVPDPAHGFSRLSITGDQLFVEVHNIERTDNQIIQEVSELLGIPEKDFTDVKSKKQSYAKINPVEDGARKKFIHWATVTHNLYSLGRYATWRPGLLLDDLVNDIRLIDRWISEKSHYDVAKAS